MKKLLNLNVKTIIIWYIILDVLSVGFGMGVPMLCILLGFPLGWYLARKFSPSKNEILKWSILAALFTFLLMVTVWGRSVMMSFDSGFDFENFGHPFILYEAKASFIAWEILMILISPFLQLLATVFTVFVTLIRMEKK